MEEDKEKKSVKRSDWDIRPYLAIGALIFLVFCCCIVVFTMIFKYSYQYCSLICYSFSC